MTGTMMLLGAGHSAASVAGGGGGSFVPSTYGTVLSWWDMSDTSKVLNNSSVSAANSEAIATVTDKGPNSYNATQTSSGSRPTLITNVKNGLQVCRCGGTGWLELVSAVGLTANKTGLTTIIVSNQASRAATQSFFYFEDHAANLRYNAAMLSDGQWEIQGNRVDGGTTVGTNAYQNFSGGGNLSSLSTWYVTAFVIDYTGDLCKVVANNVTKISGTSLGLGGGTSSNTNSLEHPTLFSSGLFGAGIFNGDVGEVVMFDGALDATHIANACTSVGSKWGMTI